MPRRQTKQAWKSAPALRLFEATGHPPTIEDAVRLAASSLLEGVDLAPTDLDAIARKLGETEVLWREEEIEELEDTRHDDGLLFFHTTGLRSISERYEAAYGLAEAYFDSLRAKGQSFRGVAYEQLCRMLTDELLIPSEAFHELRGGEISIEKMEDLSQMFDVSLRMVARRMVEIPYVALFEADDNYVTWAYGGVSTGLIDNQNPAFRSIIYHGIEHEYDGPIRFFSPKRPWFGTRCVEWTRLPWGKTMYLLRLPFRDEPEDPDKDFSAVFAETAFY